MRRSSMSRTPKLEQGSGTGFAPLPSSTSSAVNRGGPTLRSRRTATKAAGASNERSLVERIGILLWKMARTPRGLGLILLASVLWLVGTAVSNGHHKKLMQKQVPASLLPLIRHGGNVIHYVSPAAGVKIKSWHDEQLARSGNRPLSEQELEALGSHTFHPNGLLLVNPRGPHPIHALIDKAEKESVPPPASSLLEPLG